MCQVSSTERGNTVSTHDLDMIAANLRAAFPALDVATTRMLGGGFRSLVVETDGGIVFRIARNQDAAAGYARETLLLPAIGPRLPVAVPDPRWSAGPSESFPFGVMGYPRLRGRPLQPRDLAAGNAARIARDVAAFLVALHRVPPRDVTALGLSDLPDPGDRVAGWPRLRDEVTPALRDVLTPREYGAVEQWWDGFLADDAMRRYTPALCHGDLWYENILVDDRGAADNGATTVAGGVDFECAAVGDPARDFATQLHLGAPFARVVVRAYRELGGVLDDGVEHRVRRWWEAREFDGLRFALRHDDAAEFRDALAKVRASPILSPGEERW